MARLRSIVADAGPLIALGRLRQLELLAALFDQVLVPSAVERECCRDMSLPGARAIGVAITQEILQIQDASRSGELRSPAGLGPGEGAAIALSAERQLPLLMDDRFGRQVAQGSGLAVIGLGGVLLQAKRHALIPALGPLLFQLRDQGYRLSERLVTDLLRRADEEPST